MSTSTLSPTRRPAALGRWAPLPVVLAGVFMVVLDFFIVNVAAPSMQAGLHAGSATLEWVVAGYSLTAALGLLPAGRLADRHGRRLAFALGLGVFTLASALCGLAGSPLELVVARLLQGVGAAIVMPSVLSLVAVLYTGADRARALSAYGATMGLAAVSGQLIGGLLLAADPLGLGWRAVFLINLPIGVAALAFAPRAVPESRAPGAGRPDPASVVLFTAALTAIVLPLLEGRQHGWPAWTWASLGAGLVGLAGFAARQRALESRGDGEQALVAPSRLAVPTLRRGLVVQLVFWCGQASFFLLFALYLQQGRGLHALAAGLVFTVLALAYVATSLVAPALTARHGRRVVGVGALLLAAGHGLLLWVALARGVGGPWWALAPGLLVGGAGMGLALPALATLLVSAARPEDAGTVSGVLSTAQNVGNAIGVALVGVVFFGALHGGYGHAFALAEAVLAGLLLAVAALSRTLPGAGVLASTAPAGTLDS